MNVSDSQKGFSLVEVLVAVLVASLTLGVIMNMLSGASKSAAVNSNYRTALQIAESKLEELSGNPESGDIQNGEILQYRWRTRVTPWQDEKPSPVHYPFALYQLQVEVSWDDREDYPVQLKTLRLGGRS